MRGRPSAWECAGDAHLAGLGQLPSGKRGRLRVQRDELRIIINNLSNAATPGVSATVGARAILATVGIGTLLALCGSLVSAFWVMKVEPMEILAGRS